MQYYEEMMSPLCETVQKAGLRILQDWRMPMSVARKADDSPKTSTDDAAEEIVLEDILKLSSLPVVAEEEFARSHTPKAGVHDRFWLVDALDGTRQFIEGMSDFSVNIALIENGVPTFGIIHAPVTGDTWFAYKGGGAHHTDKDGQTRQIMMRTPNRNALHVLGGRSSAAPATMEPFLGEHSIAERGVRSSSLKFCWLAEGRWDVYPRLGETYEWDTASGDIILSEAGGAILDIRTGARLAYNKVAPDFLNTGFIAGHAALFKGPAAKVL